MSRITYIGSDIISLVKTKEEITMVVISWGLMMIALGLLCYLWNDELKEEEN